MKKKFIKQINIRQLILMFAISMTLLTLLNAFYSAWRVQEQVLMNNALSKHRAYAEKVAATIDLYLTGSIQHLSYSASLIGENVDNKTFILKEIQRIQHQDSGFDAITLINADARLIAAFPDATGLTGHEMNTPGVRKSLKTKLPQISNAYSSATGELVVYVSVPVFDPRGQYYGVLGGSIYLHQKNILSELIRNHYQRDNSYVYLVDNRDVVLYHPDPERIGGQELGNAVVEAVERGESGAMHVTNSRGVAMLAGFSSVHQASWGVVSQQSLKRTLEPVDTLMWQMVAGVMPLGLLGLLVIGWFAHAISHPLRQLADGAEQPDIRKAEEDIRNVKSWYVEATYIRQALLKGLSSISSRMRWLDDQANQDPLTGLLNRRATESVLQQFGEHQTRFAIISLDIDHFKRVNDTLGHDMGDIVLQSLASTLQDNSRQGDYACRMGGEEFLLLLPETPLAAATGFAERLRETIAGTQISGVGSITISAGVTVWPEGEKTITEALKKADELMYQAKRNGRNRTESEWHAG